MPPDRPRLALTLGDCAGIGPELVLRALASEEVASSCQLCVYGNGEILERVSRATGLVFPRGLVRLSPAQLKSAPREPHILLDFPFPEAAEIAAGRLSPACGKMAFTWVEAAVADALAGGVDALVTAPINKEALHAAGIGFPGHTEILANLTGTPHPCMAFYSPALVVSLATIHEPIAAVPRLLTVDALERTIRLTHQACQRFGMAQPRIGVLALNPHAGEHGLFGREESETIAPAIARAVDAHIDARGPLVPDTAFTWLANSGTPPPYDAYVAMYHDQGLIPFKTVAFDTGVNVTLGLPIVRTSPDHGTAFDLAWKGAASPDSLFSAIALAARMSRQRA